VNKVVKLAAGPERRKNGKEAKHQYNEEFEAKLALEAIKGQRTLSAMTGRYSVHPNMAMQWKKQAVEELPKVFWGPASEAAEGALGVKAAALPQIALDPVGVVGVKVGRKVEVCPGW
jgi:hypothetical protein